MEIKTLNEIEQEVKRFMKRLNAAREKLKTESYGSRETGAVKRAALDLKSELTRITK